MKNRDAELFDLLHAQQAAVHSPERTLELLESVPPELRMLSFTRRSIPEEYLPSFGYYHDKIGDLHLGNLPEGLQTEFIYVIWRIIEEGGRVPIGPMGSMIRELACAIELLRESGRDANSLMDHSPETWCKAMSSTWIRRNNRLPSPTTFRTIFAPMSRAWKILWFAYDTSSWWEREVWSMDMDPRIPRRAQESLKQVSMHWHTVSTPWLRKAAMFYMKTELEAQRVAWSTALTRLASFVTFDRFVVTQGLRSPRLTDDPGEVRALMLTFLTELRIEEKVSSTRGPGQRKHSTITSITSTIRNFYVFAHDHGDTLARAVDDPRWRDLSPEFLRFWRPGDLPRKRKTRFDERHLISDATMAEIAAKCHELGDAREDGGLADPQAMRILLLMMATGRRISEICMLDAEPLINIERGSDGKTEVAKLRYQQTKIEGAPDTIFVDHEVIGVIREQQAWLAARRQANGTTGGAPYLFVSRHNNRHGMKPYLSGVFRHQVSKLASRAGLLGEDGELLRIAATHRFRHTKATSLINAGVPLHVVQRYLGHTTPAMTMVYAHTLDSTAKAEFLRYQKITTSGRHPEVSPDDLYDLMALDARTDRILPNGWCTLPPAKTCDKGNACLTCNMFVTDERFLGVHEGEIVALDGLIESRQQAHKERTGERMTENHVWLTLRRREQQALTTIVETINESKAARSLVVGPGVEARQDADRAGAPKAQEG
ncbi:Site-specific recombinase XerD [Plantibacter flavus]|uniref:Site-specific recombinase XerD n=2 Tax=Plantibacter flavus TaxID=150123 RepID=A0A3N2C6W1_9MICO|nr:site-specific recombinase XerD [Plantibacter flavus]SMG21877.1 Site-specific recombinase XerD [Plantibacter flavus]